MDALGSRLCVMSRRRNYFDIMADYFNQESERLIYRAVTLEDAEPWSEFFTNNPNLPYMGLPVQGTPLELGKWWIENQFKR